MAPTYAVPGFFLLSKLLDQTIGDGNKFVVLFNLDS